MSRQCHPKNCRGLCCLSPRPTLRMRSPLAFYLRLWLLFPRAGWLDPAVSPRRPAEPLPNLPLGWREPRVELPSSVSFSSLWEERLGSSPSSWLLLWRRFGLAASRLVPDVRIWSPVRCVSAAAVQPAVPAAASVLAGVAAWK